MLAHIKESGHSLCTCGGYHYAHRPGSPYCRENIWSDVRHADRAGEPEEVLLEIAAHIAFENPGKPSKAPCPF